MNTPRVSIAMGVYRPRRDYLLDSVESIIAQTFEDWELIICNDGSAGGAAEGPPHEAPLRPRTCSTRLSRSILV